LQARQARGAALLAFALFSLPVGWAPSTCARVASDEL
jgi:hypothetical protein